MLERRTVIDQIEITHGGPIQIRFGKQIVDSDTGQVLAQDWHRTAIEPGTDVDEQIAAVNSHLKQMGSAECPPEETTLLKQVVTLVHTPEVIAEYQAARDAEIAAAEAPQ